MKLAGIAAIVVVVVLLVVFPFTCLTGENVDNEQISAPGDEQQGQTHAAPGQGMVEQRSGTPASD